MERGEPKGSLFASCKETACGGNGEKTRQKCTKCDDRARLCRNLLLYYEKKGERKMASFVTHFLNVMFRHMPIIEDTEEERRQNAARPLPKPPKGVTVGDAGLSVPCELVEKQGNGDIFVLNIHGGGFTTGSAKETRALSFYLCDKLGYNVLACDYRLAPEHKLPAAFEDCFEVYRAVIKKYPRLIVLGGSAGGALAIGTVQRAMRAHLPLPLAVAAFSPVAGIGMDLPSHKANIKTDYMLKRDPSGGKLLAKLVPAGAGEDFLKDPSISPVYGEFRGFPPLFLSVSDSEVLYDDSKLLYEKAKTAGVKCKLEIGHKQLHAWASIPQIPESHQTLQNMKTFFDEAVR